MNKYLVLVKCPENEVYHPYDNRLVDHDTAFALAVYLNGLMNQGGYYYIVTEIELHDIIN